MRTLFIVAVCLGFCQVTSHLIRGLRNDLTHCQKKAVDEGEDLHMDVVYTYVNGNDPGFLKEKKSHEHAKKDKTDKKKTKPPGLAMLLTLAVSLITTSFG